MLNLRWWRQWNIFSRWNDFRFYFSGIRSKNKRGRRKTVSGCYQNILFFTIMYNERFVTVCSMNVTWWKKKKLKSYAFRSQTVLRHTINISFFFSFRFVWNRWCIPGCGRRCCITVWIWAWGRYWCRFRWAWLDLSTWSWTYWPNIRIIKSNWWQNHRRR